MSRVPAPNVYENVHNKNGDGDGYSFPKMRIPKCE